MQIFTNSTARTHPPKVLLIHHPTVALKIHGFTAPGLEEFSESGLYLGNVYRKIMPASLVRVASVIENELSVEVEVFDLRTTECAPEQTYKTIEWEGCQVEARSIGAPFDYADEAINRADWVGLSSHFTYESGVIKDLIAHIKRVAPAVKVMVGGADARARPEDYLNFGADLVFVGDFNPQALAAHDGVRRIVGPYIHPFVNLTTPSFYKLKNLRDYTDSHDGPVPPGVSCPIGFIYLTRGCPRECDFCESRKTRFEALNFEACVALLEHYRRAGIRTINFTDDNLLLMTANAEGRKNLIALLVAMREMKFAWEFPNGLEIGLLLRAGKIDEELMEALFTHYTDKHTGRIIGAYRLYVPLETFDQRSVYKKLKPLEEQNRIIEWLASCGLPQIDFGVIISPEATQETFTHIRDGYLEIKNTIERRGRTEARYAIFHLIPIALHRNMATKYPVEVFPEGWNFHFPVYDGAHFSARELFEKRLRLIKEIDVQNYRSMVKGQYRYS